jgi:hypothetical protein
MTVAYASFTDGQTYYDPSSISGSYDDATRRVFLETPRSLEQDTLAIVTDDSGDLIPASAFGTQVDSLGRVTTNSVTGRIPVTRLLNTASFSSAVNSVTNMFSDAFAYNMIIGSQDPLEEDDAFIVSQNTASFEITSNLVPFQNTSVTLETADSLFFDKRFANFAQFKFLPPITSKGNVTSSLGIYTNLKDFNQYTYDDLKSEVFGTEENPVKQRFEAEVVESSLTNDMVIQLFEINNDSIVKLDAVDYGMVSDPADSLHPNKRIIFFGKVFIDKFETPTYINLFTMVVD